MQKPTRKQRPALILVRLVGLWILAGALFKLVSASPALLPPIVQDWPPMDLGLKLKLILTAELAMASLALVRPAWAWPFLIATLLLFDGILSTMLDASSCGCFGDSFEVPPIAMLSIDTVLLVALCWSRPWQLERGLPAMPLRLLLVVLLAASAVIPWMYDRQIDKHDASLHNDTGETPGRAWIELDLASWEGQSLLDTPLTRFLDPLEYFGDGLWVFWRATCEHCASHLEEMARTEQGERLIVLVQIKEPNDTLGNRVVHQLPTGNWVQNAVLPDHVDYVITTPGELEVAGWEVIRGAEAVGD